MKKKEMAKVEGEIKYSHFFLKKKDFLGILSRDAFVGKACGFCLNTPIKNHAIEVKFIIQGVRGKKSKQEQIRANDNIKNFIKR